ncbi:MAG: hypothetical protein ABI574_08020 [Burkholderiales bacterium]
MSALTITPVNDNACRVLDASGLHVGNLKLINGRWKFKAIGYDPTGAVIPGGGPLTDRHNAQFATPDAAAISAVFARV